MNFRDTPCSFTEYINIILPNKIILVHMFIHCAHIPVIGLMGQQILYIHRYHSHLTSNHSKILNMCQKEYDVIYKEQGYHNELL